LRNKRSDGAAFEDLASRYLQAKGYRILARNLHILRKEVDIVAADGDTIVFIEVKGRRSSAFGSPGEAVGVRKQRHLLRLAGAYLRREGMWEKACRFDVVGVTLSSEGEPLFSHIENAFGA
jgi:putative endonuclease